MTADVSGSASDATFPAKFWASRGGLIDVKPLGACPQSQDQVLDRMMIWEAFSRFGIGHDEDRVDVVLSCLTDDVTFEFATGSATADVTLHGKEAVRARLAPNLSRLYGQRRHCITNVVIDDFTAATATAIAYGIVSRAADGLIIQASVLYAGKLRKEADGYWRFSRFFIGCDDYAGEGPGKPKFFSPD
jgi:hypothetical protein